MNPSQFSIMARDIHFKRARRFLIMACMVKVFRDLFPVSCFDRLVSQVPTLPFTHSLMSYLRCICRSSLGFGCSCVLQTTTELRWCSWRRGTHLCRPLWSLELSRSTRRTSDKRSAAASYPFPPSLVPFLSLSLSLLSPQH